MHLTWVTGVGVCACCAFCAICQGIAEEKSVSACLGNWDLVSWVNPKTFKGDWVSLMQYGESYDNASWPDYLSSATAALTVSGLRKELINVGVGTYSSGGEWCQASTACPELEPDARFCSGPGANKTHICSNRLPSWHCAQKAGPHCGPDGGCPVPLGGKHGALSIGQGIRQAGFGGSFMFEVDYDAAGENNLLRWLDKGLRPRHD